MAKRAKSINELATQLARIRENIEQSTGMSVENPSNPMFQRFNSAYRAFMDYNDNIGDAEITRRGLNSTEGIEKNLSGIRSTRYPVSEYTQGTRLYRDGTQRNARINPDAAILGNANT